MMQLYKQISFIVKILQCSRFFAWTKLEVAHLLDGHKRFRSETFIPGFIDSPKTAFPDYLHNTVASTKGVSCYQSTSNTMTRRNTNSRPCITYICLYCRIYGITRKGVSTIRAKLCTRSIDCSTVSTNNCVLCHNIFAAA